MKSNCPYRDVGRSENLGEGASCNVGAKILGASSKGGAKIWGCPNPPTAPGGCPPASNIPAKYSVWLFELAFELTFTTCKSRELLNYIQRAQNQTVWKSIQKVKMKCIFMAYCRINLVFRTMPSSKKVLGPGKITFSNFSCMFLNPNNFFQFEF